MVANNSAIVKINSMIYEEIFMHEALVEAKKAFNAGEVPVGAVLVYEGKIVARAHNRVEQEKDATCHAEMLCIRASARLLGNWRLTGATLYCTLEPCSMCAGALLLARVDTLVYGAKDLRHGADGSFIDLLKKKHPTHEIKVYGGVLEEEARTLMQTFFQQRRKEKTHVELFDELAEAQRKKLRTFAERTIPNITDDDLLQPNDFPTLENHPNFRYEEGVLEGLLTARMALLAQEREGQGGKNDSV